MTTTIMMPQQIDQAIREMCGDAMTQAVAALAEKYNFDAEEAHRFLGSTEVKLVRKRGPSPKTVGDEKTKTKTKGATKVTADKPKRGKTGYLLYADEVRAETRAELEAELEEGDKLKPQDVVKAIAAKWKAEDQAVRDEWNLRSKTPPTSDDEAVVEPEVEPEVEVEVEPQVESVVEPEVEVVVEKPKAKKATKSEAKTKADAKAKAKADAKVKVLAEPELEAESDESEE